MLTNDVQTKWVLSGTTGDPILDALYDNDVVEKIGVTEMPAEPATTANLKVYLDRTEAGDGELFSSLFKGKFVYDRSESVWYVWHGHYWQEDKLGKARREVVTTIASAYAGASADALKRGQVELSDEYHKRARSLTTKKRSDYVLDLAKDNPGMSVVGDEWDKNLMLLGTPNGVVNLLDGTIQDGKPEQYIRSHTNVEYTGLEAQSEVWDKFVSDLCDGIVATRGGNKTEIEGFIHRLLGYFITGDVREKVLPIMWGEYGYNGRTTLQETLRAVLGDDFVYTVSADVLMATKHSDRSAPQPHLYALRGKRAVFATESKEGQRIDGSFVKQVTGMDSFKTHGKYTKTVTVDPTFKITLLTNKKPHIDVEDDALWRRILLIPFGISYVDNPAKDYERKADKELGARLKKDGSAILSWLVRGCLEWQKHGLGTPQEILAATNEYRKEEDVIEQFVTDALEFVTNYNARAQDVYNKYVEWAIANGMKPMSQTLFGRRMNKCEQMAGRVADASGKPYKDNMGRYYKGVKTRLYFGAINGGEE